MIVCADSISAPHSSMRLSPEAEQDNAAAKILVGADEGSERKRTGTAGSLELGELFLVENHVEVKG